MVEILFNDKIKNYTLEESVQGSKSYKRIPLKFKVVDSTSKYRKEILKKSLFSD